MILCNYLLNIEKKINIPNYFRLFMKFHYLLVLEKYLPMKFVFISEVCFPIVIKYGRSG